MRRRPISILALPFLALVPAACSGGDAAPRAQVERDTLGDTVVVRTVAGSEWGEPAELVPEVKIGVFEGEDEYMFGQVGSLAVAPDGSIYVMDRQAPALRKYSPDGKYVATFGREGAGPGEYKGPDGGLAVLDDGRVVLRDPANTRMQIYSPTGEPIGEWKIRGGFNTSSPLYVDTAGRVYTQVLLDPTAGLGDWRMGLVAYDSHTGQPGDTVAEPTWDYERQTIVASQKTDGGTSTSMNYVPFTPHSSTAFSPLGYWVGGVSDRYAIDEYRPDGVLRIERTVDPVPVGDGEKSNEEDIATWGMRTTQPDWKWNGAAIPDTKPAFRSVYTGADGRVWVMVHRPAERIPDDQIQEASDGPNPQPPRRWREPVAFDVFEPDGTYLGQVSAPAGFSIYPTPVFDGDRVWAVVRDELDVQYVTRFRVSHGAAESST